MIKVTIASTELRNMKGVGKASGKPYDMDFQTAYVHTLNKQGQPHPFPEKIELIVEKGSDGIPAAYPIGDYTLHPSSFYVDRGGNLAIAPRLAAIKKPA